jgi:hypothetical protein
MVNYMEIQEASEAAKKNMETALKKKALSTAGIEQEENGWKVIVEIVEEEHIPNKFDLIGIYDVKIDNDGKVTGWSKRTTRIRG